MKSVVLFVVIVFMFLGTGAVYGMGGGGHSGDGRANYLQKSGTNDGAFPGQGIGYDNSNAGGTGNHYGWDKDRDNDNGNDPVQRIPEPFTLLLLGSGLVSLAVVRKKMR